MRKLTSDAKNRELGVSSQLLRRARKSRVLLAFVAAGACAGSASAQSSVTIFGIIDETLRDVKNGSGGSLKSLTNGGYQGNRLGFRGAEDLGDGLEAIFWLEHGFNADTGTQADATKFWNRKAIAGLRSKTLGEIRLGRDLTPSYLAFASNDPTADNGLAGISSNVNGLGSGVLTIVRADNLVSYLLPDTLGGAFGQASVAPGEGTVGAKYAGGALGWRNDLLRVSASYAETTITTDKYKQALIGGNYDFGIIRVYAQFIQSKYRASKQSLYYAAASVPVGLGSIRASYALSNLSGPAVAGQALADADDSSRISLGYAYNLSKRSTLYATVATLQNKGAAKVTLSGGPAGLRSGESSRGFEMGLRHAF